MGVPQGSIAGPILFNVFLNDLLIMLSEECTVYNYADDNTLSFSHEDPFLVKRTLENAARKAIEWFSNNSMKANPNKFQAIIFQTKRGENAINEFSITDEITIKTVDYVKLLGLTIDKELDFSQHIKEIIGKCSRLTNAVARLSKLLSTDSKMAIFRAFVQSTLDYCSAIYHHCNMNDARKIELIQKRFLRIILNDYDSSYIELLSKAKQDSQFLCRQRSLIEIVHRIINNLLPPIDDTFFTARATEHNLRGLNMLVKPRYKRKKYGYRSLSFQGPTLWNDLPDEMRNEQNHKKFKSLTKAWDPKCQCNSCSLCTLNAI